MLHLSINWPWQQAWTAWYNRVCGPPVASEVRQPPHASTGENLAGSAIKINPRSNRWIEA